MRTRFDPTNVLSRIKISNGDVAARIQEGTLIADERRVRSRYFDGKFLTAKDLIRDQTHYLTRQSDLGRAIGNGVVHGLKVQLGISAGKPDGTLEISSGAGLTASGELVTLNSNVQIRINAIPEMPALDAALGLARIPSIMPQHRNGLYVLALRPVEYTANPIASYPTSLDAGRFVHDADRIEAAAITLFPYPDRGVAGTLNERRSSIARAVFVESARPVSRTDTLPIAMIALEHGVVRWIDSFLVRREVVKEQSSVLGLIQPSLPLREAHFMQYDAHYTDVLDMRALLGQGLSFPATEHFQALPPAGRVPIASVDVSTGKQFFFPPEVDVALSIVPEDELAAMLDEALHLPPIDLTQQDSTLEGASVLLLIPQPRDEMDDAIVSLGSTALASSPQQQAAWSAAFAKMASDSLWFVRRNNFSAMGKVAPIKYVAQ